MENNTILYCNSYIVFVLQSDGSFIIIWSKHHISGVYSLDDIKSFSGLFFKIKSEYEKLDFSKKKNESIYELFHDDVFNTTVEYVIFENQKPVIVINFNRSGITMDSDIVEVNGFVKGFNKLMRQPELLSGLVK